MLSGAALADGFSGQVGLGYQTSSVDTNYGECWSECFGDQEPSGLAIEAKINFGPSLFATLDYAKTKDSEDHWDDSVSSVWNDQSIGLGYTLVLTDVSAVTFAVEYSDVEWEYNWKDATGTSSYYNADDSGVSFAVGAIVDVNDKMTAGAAVSLGFSQGIEAFTQYALTESLALKVSYEGKSYELGNFSQLRISNSGVTSVSDPSSDDGDGDYQLDNQIFRVGAVYKF